MIILRARCYIPHPHTISYLTNRKINGIHILQSEQTMPSVFIINILNASFKRKKCICLHTKTHTYTYTHLVRGLSFVLQYLPYYV